MTSFDDPQEWLSSALLPMVFCVGGLALLVGTVQCNIDFESPSQGETFPCTSDDDCLDGFTCKGNDDGESVDGDNCPDLEQTCGVCVERCENSDDCERDGFICGSDTNYCIEGCTDKDGDGWGSNEDPERRERCGACENPSKFCEGCSREVRCARDCDDFDEDQHPGPAHLFEVCDGKDNNCDGKLAAGPKTVDGKELEDQPIRCGGAQENCDNQSSDQSKVVVRCSENPVKESDGSEKVRQCVAFGLFTCTEDCRKPRFCNSEGEWETVPEECKTAQSCE